MKSHFDIEFLEQATEKLKAIAHPIRFVIVEMLSRENELSVTDIHEKLDIEQAVASHHLRILKNQNVVKVTRDGKNSFYSLTSTSFSQIIDNMIAAG
ncbi:MAG: winged helix-turn-helix transcriptional regulator [Saprospiraceae bacterium]|nr:winged helix-turn-helix transcriptional regulator [Saprospiraceae bacterium]MBK7221528.1 winged helix-turn-helix transcriptional regulator [Saprospiraceae bacterium]MBK7788390.1 winged helix-turn-helix transcriptional regulator [Saprospiraceae bacterium]MBK8851606.1 winged helix-turn-helix transcriptional regulator [Saprospiraceae bacterium]MBK9686255.1 winged helix-turn-helix transcriptional regulator [Saprospiraceae bacterium]